ncbi:sigma 54-interacting transcriptional regulator [candidate division KSB1 bacterium]|nr:sigma 54-interacting transcriptional regulator [candidate division KSB1 bacterium]
MKKEARLMKRKPTLSSLKRKLNILGEINQFINRNLEISTTYSGIIQILEKSYPIKAGVIYLLDSGRKNLECVASYGFSRDELRLSFSVAEGLTGRVADTGKPVIIPQVSKEPLLREPVEFITFNIERELSFISVPISLDFQIFGVMNIIMPYSPTRDYETTLQFFTLVASALLQPVTVRDIIEHERQKLIDENVRLKQKLQDEFRFNNIIGNSHEMRDVLEQVARVSRLNATVLIRGESGTGKELIAEAIHYNSQRKDKPFIRVNCAAIPENLIESEFFGFEKGAFTGADYQKKGRFELADKGTIFLDEVGELSPLTQVKLLRVLQKQEFERVGGTETIRVDIRIITATNSNLEELMNEGHFREDLYYRLNVFSIYLPPLRERKTDILLLADHFMLKYGKKHGKSIKRISTPAIDMLMRYHWPGNVRELENCIERAVILCEDEVIHSYNLPPTLQTAESSNTTPRLTLKDAIASYEKELIQDALKSARGNRAKAARLLDTTERIMAYKIKNYEINVTKFKS